MLAVRALAQGGELALRQSFRIEFSEVLEVAAQAQSASGNPDRM